MRLLVEVSILVPEVYNPLILAARPRQAADRFSDFEKVIYSTQLIG